MVLDFFSLQPLEFFGQYICHDILSRLFCFASIKYLCLLICIQQQSCAVGAGGGGCLL